MTEPRVSFGVINNADRATVATEADEFKLNGFDLKLPIAQTRWTTLQYYNTRTTNKEDMQDAYDGTKAAATDPAIRVNTPPPYQCWPSRGQDAGAPDGMTAAHGVDSDP